MYQQQTATVHIFLKVSAMDSLVFFSEYISRTAILTQASKITLYIEFLVLVLHVQPLLFHFSKINMKSGQCSLLVVSLLNSQGIKHYKSRESFCLSILTAFTQIFGPLFDMFTGAVFIFSSARFLNMCNPRTGQLTSIGILWK